MTDAILDEFLVIDLSQGPAGAYCCLLFRHLGAEVVRIDAPDADGKGAALRRLAERADVLIVDGDLPSELDYAALSAQNPRLVLTRIVERESEGPFAQHFAGLNAFAATLLPLLNMSITGRGQEVEVDAAECLAAAAFVVDGAGEWPRIEGDGAPPPPFRLLVEA